MKQSRNVIATFVRTFHTCKNKNQMKISWGQLPWPFQSDPVEFDSFTFCFFLIDSRRAVEQVL